jgi:hypothetical protein
VLASGVLAAWLCCATAHALNETGDPTPAPVQRPARIALLMALSAERVHLQPDRRDMSWRRTLTRFELGRLAQLSRRNRPAGTFLKPDLARASLESGSQRLAELTKPPTWSGWDVQVVSAAREDSEILTVQFPGGGQFAVLPFLEGFRASDADLGRAGGRLLVGTAGLQLISPGSWTCRLQISYRFHNTCLDGSVASDLGLVLLRRF